MGTYINIQGRGTITLPASVRKLYHLDAPGAQVEIIEQDGTILLRPKLPVDAAQAWFWQSEWQDGERVANEEHAAGRGEVFDDGTELLDSLNSPSLST